MRRYQTLVATCVLAVVSACASGPPQKLETDDPRPCAKNFTYSGFPMLGQTFKTNQFVGGVTKHVAVERASKRVIKEGMTLATLDKEAGIISAFSSVSGGRGETVALAVTVESAKNGVNIEVSISTSLGQVTSADSLKDFFCGILSAAAGK